MIKDSEDRTSEDTSVAVDIEETRENVTDEVVEDSVRKHRRANGNRGIDGDHRAAEAQAAGAAGRGCWRTACCQAWP